MSIASLTAVANRVNQIQTNFERNTASRVTFAETLQTAQQPAPAPAPDGSFVVTPQALNAATPVATGFLPVGIMGTSIILHSGRSIAAGPVSGDWAAQLPAAGQQWAGEIERAAHEAGLDPRLLAAMVWQESRFQPDAISHSGAIGLAQLMPATAEELGVDPSDPIQNLSGGARYLAWTIKEFGSIDLGLAAYNAGPTRVREADGIPNIAETQAYVPRVLDYYRQLGGAA